MSSNGLFAKDVYIRLTDDWSGFLYTVKYPWFSLTPRQIPLFQESGNPRRAQVTQTPHSHFDAAPSAPAGAPGSQGCEE